MILRALHRLLGSSDTELEDLTQHALIELVTTIDRFRGGCSLDTWASRIAAHVAWNEIRSRRVRRKYFETEVDTDQDPRAEGAAPSHLRAVAAKRLVERIIAELRSIEETKALTYWLHDVCGYDLREVAQITETSVSAAQTRLVRGRRELQERIAHDPSLRSSIETWERS